MLRRLIEERTRIRAARQVRATSRRSRQTGRKVLVRPGLRIGIEEVESASGFEGDDGAGTRQGIAVAAVRFEGGQGINPFASEKARWASFQSPQSRGGRSRVNGTLNCSAMAR